MSNTLYNLSMIEEMAGGDEAFIAMLAKTFADTVPPIMQQMVQHFNAGNWKEMGLEAHSLKSNILTLQITSIEQEIKLLEQYGKNATNLHEVPALIEKVTQILPQAIQQLKMQFQLT
jgi:HPt (histidine-containing phosphotransfer) domain-containing protein